jgi:hypothetical protein
MNKGENPGDSSSFPRVLKGNSMQRKRSTSLFILIMVGFMLLLAESPAQAWIFCHHGRHHCRWCERAGGTSRSMTSSGQTQQFVRVGDIHTIIDLLRLVGVDPDTRGGSGREPSEATLKRIEDKLARIDALVDQVRANTEELDRFNQSQTALANKIDAKFTVLEDRVTKIDDGLRAVGVRLDSFEAFNQPKRVKDVTPYFKTFDDTPDENKKIGDFPAGTKVLILDGIDDFVRVRTTDSRFGWVRRDSIEE